jgi:hypothetical protein
LHSAAAWAIVANQFGVGTRVLTLTGSAAADPALAETLGLIAKILVQRALRQARTSQELWDLLAVHINPAAARAGFLGRRDQG